jgi:hypothetical protein
VKKLEFKLVDEYDRNHAKNTLMMIDLSSPMQMTIEPETRESRQNKQQWPYLNACASQLLWEVEGEMSKMTEEEWKDLITAGFTKEKFRVARGIDGGVVMVGKRTSKFSKKVWPEWMEYLKWFCADRDVKIPVSKSQAESMGWSA